MSVLSSMDATARCLACNAEVEGLEPDVEEVQCPECGELAVAGAEQLALMEAS